MTFTPEDVKRVTKEIVEEYGEDYVYPHAGSSCVYAEGGEPSCLLGHIAYRLDRDLFNALALRDIGAAVVEGSYAGVTSDRSAFIQALSGSPEASYTEETREVFDFEQRLFRAQSRQDTGSPWGVAAAAILEDPED
jgi:hypothetical protein